MNNTSHFIDSMDMDTMLDIYYTLNEGNILSTAGLAFAILCKLRQSHTTSEPHAKNNRSIV